MKSAKTPCIVLRRTNYGEADRILQILTPDGKKSVMARGARKEKSKLAGGIELFAICEIVMASGKGDIGTLVSSRLVKFFNNIIADYDKMQFGYEVIKLVSAASETTDSEEWFDLLLESLAGLDSKSVDLRLVKTWFLMNYSQLLGYELGLYYDANGEKITSERKYNYDVNEKSLIVNANGNITSDHIKLARLISQKPLKVLAKIGGIGKVIDDCLDMATRHASIR